MKACEHPTEGWWVRPQSGATSPARPPPAPASMLERRGFREPTAGEWKTATGVLGCVSCVSVVFWEGGQDPGTGLLYSRARSLPVTEVVYVPPG